MTSSAATTTASLTLEGRADFYVKVRGVRVSTQVVEQAIQEHPEVIEVAVVAVPDELAGNRLHAVLRREPDSKLNSLTLRKHCAERLARTEMPSTIEIVTEPLPKTSTGKIDRKLVLARLEEVTHANVMRPPRRSSSSSSTSSCQMSRSTSSTPTSTS